MISFINIFGKLFSCLSDGIGLISTINNFSFILSQVTIFLHFLWAGPLQAAAVVVLLWYEIGPSCLAGMAVLVFLMPIQTLFGRLFSSLRCMANSNNILLNKLCCDAIWQDNNMIELRTSSPLQNKHWCQISTCEPELEICPSLFFTTGTKLHHWQMTEYAQWTKLSLEFGSSRCMHGRSLSQHW